LVGWRGGASPATAASDPLPQRCAVDFSDSLGGDTRIDNRGDLFIRQVRGPLRSFHHTFPVRREHSEFDFSAPAEPLLPCTVLHFQGKSKGVKPSVHCFVKNRRGDLGIREIWIHREGQLDQTRALLVEIRSPAGESLHDDVCEVPLEMPEVVGNVALDQG